MSTAQSQGLVSCHHCLKLCALEDSVCSRCGGTLPPVAPKSVEKTLALLLTACVLYIPANLYPIMVPQELGTAENSTIIGGVLLLAELGSIGGAAVIFLFSIVVPSGKILALLYLVWSTRRGQPHDRQWRTRVYHATEFVGKWSLIVVFVVAVLGALVHFNGVLVIEPGVAAISFAGVVIVTMLAAHSFDSRLIWLETDGDDE